MASVLLCHSVHGLRALERDAADRLRAAGHAVVTPDLYGGRTAETVEAGFALRDAVGWDVMVARAAEAAEPLPAETVLAGFSLGAAVAAALWPERPATAGLLLLHGLVALPDNARPGLPVQVHLAEPDPWEDEAFLAEWTGDARAAGLALEIFRYPGVGHLFADPTLSGYDTAAEQAMWSRVLGFLERV
jgi:dienelactone hydrolase